MKRKQQLHYKGYLVEPGSGGKVIIRSNQKLELPIKVLRDLLDLIDRNEEFRKNFMEDKYTYTHESAKGEPNATAIIENHVIRKSLTPGELEIKIFNKKMNLDIKLLYKIIEDIDLRQEQLAVVNNLEHAEIKQSYSIGPTNLFSSSDTMSKTIDRLEEEKEILEELNKEYKDGDNRVINGIDDLGFAVYKRIKRQEQIVLNLERIVNTKAKGTERTRLEIEILECLMDQLTHTTMRSDAPKLHSKITLLNRISLQEELVSKADKRAEVEQSEIDSNEEDRKVIAFKFDKFNNQMDDLKSLLLARELKQRIPEGKVYRVSEGNLISSGQFDIVQEGIVKKCTNHYFLVIEELNLVLDPGHSKSPVPFNLYSQTIKEWNSDKTMFIELHLS